MSQDIIKLIKDEYSNGSFETQQTIRFNCPVCSDTRRRLYLTHKVGEVSAFVLYNCFNCSACGKHIVDYQFTNSSIYTQNILSTTDNIDSSRANRPTLTNYLPDKVLEAYQIKYPLMNITKFHRYNMQYDTDSQAVVHLIYAEGGDSFIGEQRRSLLYNKNGPKYITEYYNNNLVFKKHFVSSVTAPQVESIPLIVVEDILSANYLRYIANAFQYEAHICAMLGTSLTFEDIYHIQTTHKVNMNVVVWTDWDNAEVIKQTHDIVSKFQVMGWKAKPCHIPGDPKKYASAVIKGVFDDIFLYQSV